MIINKLKLKIKELAKTAVCIAEAELVSNKGQQKKIAAIEYVINKLPLPFFLRPFVKVVFSSFIDETIELAVEYMKSEEL